MEESRINLNMLGIKAKTKNELYRLLTTEANLYLPPQKETSIYFVISFMVAKRQALDL